MTIELAKDISMTSDFESDWISLEIAPVSNFGKHAVAESLQITWKDAAGTLNGTIEIIATNDINSKTVGKTIAVNHASNDNDADLFILYPSFEYLKIIYTHNGISSGKLNAVLSYRA